MGYIINVNELSSLFAVPCSIADKSLALATGPQLKVILWSLRHMEAKFDIKKICDALSLDEATVSDALLYWKNAGIILSSEETAEKEIEQPVKKAVAPAIQKPSREEIAKRGLECPEIAFLLREAELKFGRILRQNEVSTLVWLYDDQGMNLALILMLIDSCINENRLNISYIQRTAVEWIKNGVETVQQAEQYLIDRKNRNEAWHTVETSMGLEHRMPSKKELDYAVCWTNKWQFDRSMLRAAYECCVDNKAKISMPYINKVLESWHKEGIKNTEMLKQRKHADSVRIDENKEFFSDAHSMMYDDDDRM